MIAECPKVKFSDARIVGESVNPSAHHKQEHPRGHLGFVMSRGELMEFHECPVKWLANVKEEQSSFMAWGDLIDCLFTTPDLFKSRFAVCPETYPDAKSGEAKPWNWNANFCKQWREDHSDFSLIKHETFKAAEVALAKLKQCPEVADAMAPTQFQVSVWAEYFDPATELTIPIRSLVDIAPASGEYGNSLIDLKTSNTAEPRAWARKVSSDHLDAQGALYLDLWKAATGEERADFRHVIQESEPPYHVELRILSSEFIEIGRIKYRSALLKYAQCLATGVWPGYDNSRNLTFGRWAVCNPEPWMIDAA